MRYEDFENTDSELKVSSKKKKRKKAADHNGLTAFLTLIIGLLLGALIMLLVVYYSGPYSKVLRQVDKVISVDDKELNNDIVSVEKAESIAEESSTDENMAEKIDTFDEGQPADAAFSENDGLSILKEALLNGENTSKALRKAFKNELLCARDGKYHFVDIDPSIKKNDYVIENLQINDNGRYEYYFADGTKARTGVDVSKYQGEIDWEMVASDGIDFAIVRAGIRGYESGKLVMDEDFAQNITSAITAGLDVGVYFFSQAITEEEAVEEADAIIEMLDGNGLDYPMVYDLEYIRNGRRSALSVEESTQIAKAFCERVAEFGYSPMIYGNLDTFLLQLDLKQVEDIEKWFAYYDTDFYFPYEYRFWQYTDSGMVSGIGEEVDINLDFGRSR